MDHAYDDRGKPCRSNEFTLVEAKGLSFSCPYCTVPVFATRMPNWKLRPGAELRSRRGPPPELYFKARPKEPHPDWCDFGPAQVRALVEERTVSSRSGPSGNAPARIDLSAESVHKVGTSDHGDAESTRRTRSVDDGKEKRRRAPRATVVSHIRRACEAWAGRTVGYDHPLVVPEYLPASMNTYGRVFRSLSSDADAPPQAIWFATLRFTSPVLYGERVLTLLPFGGARITIDRLGWPTALVGRFDAELRILLDEAGRRWTEGSIEPAKPTFFALAERSRHPFRLVVRDARLMTVLLLKRSL